MTKHISQVFEVAGLRFEVIRPHDFELKKVLPSFVPFESEGKNMTHSACAIFSVTVVTTPIIIASDARYLTNFSGAFGDGCSLYESDGYYEIAVSYTTDGQVSVMRVNRNFESAEIYLNCEEPYNGYALSFFLMFVYAQRCVLFDTFLLHASVVVKDGTGYAFMGKSGTGKSTHSRLWLRSLENTSLLNDDNPAIRICRGTKEVKISGTPWSGKTPCYKNETVKLGALVRLVQSSTNKYRELNAFDAFLSILAGCSGMRWNNDLYMALCDTLENVVQVMPTGELECLPEESAAELCYEQIKQKI